MIAPQRIVGRFLAAWNQFWFTPQDPSTLGFIRIITGMFVFYVYLVYTIDLVAFFGPDGFYNQTVADRARHSTPMVPRSLEWDDANGAPVYIRREDQPSVLVILPDDPARRAGIFALLNSLPDQPGERVNLRLRYLNKLPMDLVESIRCLSFVQRLPRTPWHSEDAQLKERQLQLLIASAGSNREQRAKEYMNLVPSELALDRDSIQAQAVALLDAVQLLIDLPGDPREREERIPPFLSALDANERQTVRADILQLLWMLPTEPAARNHTLDHLIYLPPEARRQFVSYIHDLPTDKAHRGQILAYADMWNVDPRMTLAQGYSTWSIWFHVTDPTAMYCVHGFTLMVMFCFTLGFFTRVTSVLTWLLFISYIHRSDVVLFGQDTMANILLIYLMLSPCGAALSIDRLIARYRTLRAYQRGQRPPTWEQVQAVLAGPAPLISANFVTRLIQIHFCFIYLAAGMSKLKGQTWWNHTAMWMTIANPEFSPINFPLYQWWLQFMSSSRPLMEAFMTFGVAFTLFMEIGLPFLVWNPKLRPWMVLGGVMLHAGIGAFMGLTLFSLFMMTLLLSYIPPETIRQRFGARPDGLAKLKLHYDSRLREQARWAALIQALDIWQQLELHDTAGAEPPGSVPMKLTLPTGGSVSGYGLFAALMQSLGLLRSVGWLIPGGRPRL
jgi:hypothetical protein